MKLRYRYGNEIVEAVVVINTKVNTKDGIKTTFIFDDIKKLKDMFEVVEDENS